MVGSSGAPSPGDDQSPDSALAGGLAIATPATPIDIHMARHDIMHALRFDSLHSGISPYRCSEIDQHWQLYAAINAISHRACTPVAACASCRYVAMALVINLSTRTVSVMGCTSVAMPWGYKHRLIGGHTSAVAAAAWKG